MKKIELFDYINGLFLLIVMFVTFYPLIYVFSVSFSASEYIIQNKITFFPMGFNFEAYRMIFESARIPQAYFNSFLYTALGTFVNLTMTAITAYPLSRNKLIGKKYYMWIILLTMFFNGGLIPNYLLVKSLGMINSIWSLVIPNAIWTFELIILKGFFESLPEELHESAVIDGAKEFTIFSRIYMPLSKASLASIALFYAMGHWNSYLIPSIYLMDLEKMPLQVLLKEMLILDTAKQSSDMAEYANLTPEALKNATILISILPMLLLYPYLQKYFVGGIMIGAVKG